jgi:malate dehydrogenase
MTGINQASTTVTDLPPLPRDSLAIVGAFGTVGRQLTHLVLNSGLLPSSGRLQLITRPAGAGADQLFGFRADLLDADVDGAPEIEVGVGPEMLDADIVVMLAGQTLPHDPASHVDRAALAASNAEIFHSYARAAAARGRLPVVLVQSNPVELGVAVFCQYLDRHRVLGLGAVNDTQRLRRELAITCGVRRPDVQTLMVGQHGDNLVPLWSQTRVRGWSADEIATAVGAIRGGRHLSDFPDEIRAARSTVLALLIAGDIAGAREAITALPPGVRSAVKPFFIHYTNGRSTEASTAAAVHSVLESVLHADYRVLPAQVKLAGEFANIHGVVGVPVLQTIDGWSGIVDPGIADDERVALFTAAEAIRGTLDPILGT